MARKQKHEEHENHERWLVSYADFITLLFAFFVVMYSISSVNDGKYRVLSDTLVAAFKDTGRRMDPIQIGTPSKMLNPLSHGVISPRVSERPQAAIQQVQNAAGQSETGSGRPDVTGATAGSTHLQTTPGRGGPQESLDALSEEVQNNMASVIDQSMMTLRRHKDALEIELKSNILFSRGRARLSIPAEKILIRLASTLAKFPNAVQIEGHTDDKFYSSGLYPSNWELSSARAAAVAHLFTEHGMDPELMWAVGYGEYRPKVENLNDEMRGQNRRVVLMIRPNLSGLKKADTAQTDASVLNNASTTADPGAETKAGELNRLSQPMLEKAAGTETEVEELNTESQPMLEKATEPSSETTPLQGTPVEPVIAPIQLPFPVRPAIGGNGQ
ncbi:flagellar motor protein MotB [Sulfuriflexus mobilis]|uniref:flagellar motor protein MotB n=1 Tax=Sulfuriflexus mobilis TaxID=1811807 RepID=UPI000F843A71|nr:flagellar motor protein MotB [Sulfuriflexus mobilis]